MEVDSFLSSPRWDILKNIVNSPSSPTEISENIGTTISFVSQQLKLLEAVGLIKKEKTKAVEKGKPRSLFSISKESFYMIPLAKGFEEKKLINLSIEKKAILHIWNIEDSEFHVPLEKFFWAVNKDIQFINGIFVQIKNHKLKVYVISNDQNITHKINEAQRNQGLELDFQVTTSSSLSKLDKEFLSPIYDPQELLVESEEMKGGLE